jgi:hypothetical protein
VSPGDLRRMREAGWTYKEISEISGIPWSTIRSQCRSLRIKCYTPVVRSRNRKYKYEDRIDKELLWLMYIECQLSTSEIAYELEVNRHTLRGLMAHYDIPMRSRGEARKLYMQRVDATMPPVPTHKQAVEAGKMSGLARRNRRDDVRST